MAAEFLSGRGNPATWRKGIGVAEVRRWARQFPAGSTVLDLGCGPGFPITAVLVEAGLKVYGVDGAPSFVEAFRRNLPGVPVLCEPVERSTFYGRTFDGVLAWGLLFLLGAEAQRELIGKIARALVPGGRLLFTVCAEPLIWKDAMTGLESVSLGAEEYRRMLVQAGMRVAGEFEDAGENYYFDVVR